MAALASGVALTACTGGEHTAATGTSVVATSTPTPSSTSTQNWNRPGITPASAARFDEASGRLQGVLDAIVACMGEDDWGCVNGERDGFRAAFRDSVHNLTGLETRDNPCYQRLEDYDSVLSQLRPASRWLFVAGGQPPPRTSLSDFWGRIVQLQKKHRDLAARFLAACT
jgi:hypothetical protein